MVYFRRAILPSILYCALCGTLIGILITLYNYGANWLVAQSQTIFEWTRANPAFIPLLFVVLVLLALIMRGIHKISRETIGGGVPRAEGFLRGVLTLRPIRTMIGELFATAISYISGISLGTEGPSILLGTAIATGVNDGFRKRKAWSKQLIAGGAGAGLAVAFNAPMTGIIFTIEEVRREIKPFMIFTTACTVIIATFISRALSSLWGGGGVAFDFGEFTTLPLKNFWMLLILGLVIGICASLFITLLTKFEKAMRKLTRMPAWAKLLGAFLITGIIGLAVPATVGGGHSLIMDVGQDNYSAKMLLLLFFLKLILITVAFNSGSSGGLFVPMLCLGALLGGLFGHIFVLAGMESIMYKTIVVIAMTAFFGACVRAPITAIVLVVEITGHLNDFLMNALAIFTAFLIPMLFRLPPLYEGLVNNLAEHEMPKEPPPYMEPIATATATADATAVN